MQEGPIVDRHQLGDRLRQLRAAQALRLEDVAARLELAPSTLSRMETGQAPVRAAYLTALLDLYLRREALRRIPGVAGRNSEGGSWV